MKSPATNVLVEDSIVRQGNGLVVGTSGSALFRNITFRRCTAEKTTFACHIKFKDQQNGSVSGVLFEDITVIGVKRYAIGIDQNGQSSLGASGNSDGHHDHRSNVTINNVSFIRIHGIAPKAGQFTCNTGKLKCTGIKMRHINLSTVVGCTFSNVAGSGLDVHPKSCNPPASPSG